MIAIEFSMNQVDYTSLELTSLLEAKVRVRHLTYRPHRWENVALHINYFESRQQMISRFDT